MNAVNELLEAYSFNTTLHYDKWTEEHKYRALNDGNLKQWISNILPCELLERSLKKQLKVLYHYVNALLFIIISRIM